VREIDSGSVAVVVAGAKPLTLVDDVITDTRRSLAAGSAVVLPRNGPGEWEPTPLPGPPPPKPEAAGARKVEPGEEWEPTRLPRSPKPIRFLRSPLRSEEVEAAVDHARRGGSIRLRHPQTDELRLSNLSGIPEAARAGGGRLIVELHTDD
jgi:hypothetical protein